MIQEDFDRSLQAGSKHIGAFIRDNLPRLSLASDRQEAINLRQSLSSIQNSRTIFREDGKGIEIHVIATFFTAGKLVTQLGNEQLGAMSTGVATQALFLSTAEMIQVLTNQGDTDAWLLNSQVKDFPHIPAIAYGERHQDQVIKCFEKSDDVYAKSLAILLGKKFL